MRPQGPRAERTPPLTKPRRGSPRRGVHSSLGCAVRPSAVVARRESRRDCVGGGGHDPGAQGAATAVPAMAAARRTGPLRTAAPAVVDGDPRRTRHPRRAYRSARTRADARHPGARPQAPGRPHRRRLQPHRIRIRRGAAWESQPMWQRRSTHASSRSRTFISSTWRRRSWRPTSPSCARPSIDVGGCGDRRPPVGCC